MRDINRIPQVLNKLQELWLNYPDLRLGQLIENIVTGHILFYIEDDVMEELINSKIKDLRNEEIFSLVCRNCETLINNNFLE